MYICICMNIYTPIYPYIYMSSKHIHSNACMMIVHLCVYFNLGAYHNLSCKSVFNTRRLSVDSEESV